MQAELAILRVNTLAGADGMPLTQTLLRV